MINKRSKNEPKGPELIGKTLLTDKNGKRFKFKYQALADLHPYYEQLIEENADQLLEEVKETDGYAMNVTEKFKEEALRRYMNHSEDI